LISTKEEYAREEEKWLKDRVAQRITSRNLKIQSNFKEYNN
jgi:hypothetical protein